jgi:DNA-binding MarR family transcriptional regulator
MAADPTDRVKTVNNFCASALVFSAAMTELLESKIDETLGNKYTLSQLRLLAMVDKTDVQYVTEVADFLNVSNAAASKAVERLVRRGVIERRESKRDRRAIQLLVTEEGHRVVESFENIQHQVFGDLFGQISTENLHDTGLFLDRLTVGLVNIMGKSDGACLRCGIYFRDKCLLRDANNRDCRYHSSKNV